MSNCPRTGYPHDMNSYGRCRTCGFTEKELEKIMTDDTPKIEGLDIEEYIRNLEWSDDTPDIHKTLVGGNLRALYHKIAETITVEKGQPDNG